MTIAKDEIHIWSIPLNGVDKERARAAVSAILARYAGHPPRFQVSGSGKPSLEGATPLRFNASHSRDLALCAVACGREVGVDVERVRAGLDGVDIARRFFPPAEAAEVERHPDAFFRYWTRREAYIKALGRGLRGIREPVAEGWTVADLEVGEGWAAAVAYEGHGCRIVRQLFKT